MMKSKMLILVYLSVSFLIMFYMPAIAETLFSENFSKGADRWEEGSGKWAVKNGEYVQETEDFFTASFLRKEFWDPAWTEYTLELKAMRLKGAEAWDIVFGIQQDNVPVVKEDRKTFFDWNIGGWTNTRSALRKWVNGSAQEINGTKTDHTIEMDIWYNIKIEVSPTRIVAYLNGEKAFEHNEGPPEGRIGFEMFGTSAAYDDIIVYDAGGPHAVHPDGKLAAFWGSIKLRK
ncbi:hypothetical protein ACFL6S_23200 [Candidatus Poribacteria bacterium]